MKKLSIVPPFFCVNPKAYLYGEESLKLAKAADRLAKEQNLDIFFTLQHVDAYRIAQETSHLILTVQHMDDIEPGTGMGYILPEALADAGIKAVFLNHAEHPLQLGRLVSTMERAKKVGLLTIVCADSVAEAQALATLQPDIMVCEPTELIGTGRTSDSHYMRQSNQMIKKISPSTLVLQAAGISTPADVRQALASGADGTGGTSGIVLANDPVQSLNELVSEVAKIREETKG